MKLDSIQALKTDFRNAIEEGSYVPDSLFRLCILEWQKHFDIEEWRLEQILDEALRNKASGRYWGGEQHSIKSGLLMLARANHDLFWEAIKDLFNEERMIIMRANRFIHHCDMILNELKRTELKLNTHHQSYYSSSLLLSLQYPARYCLFDFEVFNTFCKRIGVNDIPVETDLERFYKITRTVYNIISKDEAFMAAYYEKLEDGIYFGPSLMLVYDMMQYCQKHSEK